MARPGYDAVVDIDDEADLGRTDLTTDDTLEFHNSNFETNPSSRKIASDQPFLPPGADSGATGKKGYLWSIAFYQQFFDVDTSQIFRRCLAALYPRSNFLDILDGNPDLYGPFWIATTVVVILFLTGTISSYLAHTGSSHFAYDFKLLSGAAGLIYGYTIFVPLGVWLALKWFGSQSADVLECWALYGYANLIWIPVALVSWSPLTILNYAFTAVGFALSALFLVRNLYPVISAIDARTSRALLIIVLILQAGLAVAIKILFFAHGSPVASGTPAETTPVADPGQGDGGETSRMFFR